MSRRVLVELDGSTFDLIEVPAPNEHHLQQVMNAQLEALTFNAPTLPRIHQQLAIVRGLVVQELDVQKTATVIVHDRDR